MKQLKDILYKAPILERNGPADVALSDFHFDSRKVDHGDLFIAIPGTRVDGHEYISTAIGAGASAIVCERFPDKMPEEICFIRVKDAHEALAQISANWFGDPSRELKVVGITGTNGKTTTASLLHELTLALGYNAGLISTVKIMIGQDELPATHTTPDAKALQNVFRQMVEAGCEFCFMEVSSHALVQHRVTGTRFAGALFTNITHDHLDYHGDFKSYLNAKKQLFDMLPPDGFAVVNGDDKHADYMLQNCPAEKQSFGVKRLADYKGKLLENTFDGLLMEINGTEVWFRLVGSFNASNLLGVFASADMLGLDTEEVLTHLSQIGGVSGRFQMLRSGDHKRIAIVDYAHTPDALKNVLNTIRDVNQDSGRVLTVVGCGGNRDKAKRPEMARIASELSDNVILTSDNPRDEDPAAILLDMEEGVPISMKRKVLVIENRKEAIRTACTLAQDSDIILVAGKGHETYQEIKGVRYPFDDRKIIEETFKTLTS